MEIDQRPAFVVQHALLVPTTLESVELHDAHRPVPETTLQRSQRGRVRKPLVPVQFDGGPL